MQAADQQLLQEGLQLANDGLARLKALEKNPALQHLISLLELALEFGQFVLKV